MTISPTPTTPSTAGEPRNQDTLLVASLLHLMSHYSAKGDGEPPCVKLASVIERHLCALARLPTIDPVPAAWQTAVAGALHEDGLGRQGCAGGGLT